jgi:fatty-acyl-CoA synthase
MSLTDLIQGAAASTVWSMFEGHVRRAPERIALEDEARRVSYAELHERALRLSALFAANGVNHGDRIGILSENRIEYLEVMLAAARLGAIVACQNWRLTPAELDHCLSLVEPVLVLASPRHAGAIEGIDLGGAPLVIFGDAFEAALPPPDAAPAAATVEPEDIVLILYTSGTTGLPKGAAISHRAEIARNLVIRADFGVRRGDVFVSWSPLFHMGAADTSLGNLMSGDKVVVVDGFDAGRLVDLAEREQIGWLILMPGTIDRFTK